MRHLPLPALLGLIASPAFAAPPDVVTDIPPVHSLVAQVMEGVGTPGLLLPPGGSPHGHQMRPSEAQALKSADLLIWIGPDQSPWLGDAAGAIGGDLTSIPLMEMQGTVLRLGGHDHDDDHEDDHDEAEAGHDHEEDHAHAEDDHDHDDGHEEGHDDDHDDHEDEHHTGDGHDHEGVDTHVWLDPQNALIWLPEIARQLADADPENAATYRANSEAAMARIATLQTEISGRLDGLAAGYVVYHDAYGYFTDRFDLPAAGAITDGDATPPGARRLADLQATGKEQNVRCLFTEPQFDRRSAERLAETLGAKIGVLDPVGSTLEPGPALYTDLLSGLATGLAKCLAD